MRADTVVDALADRLGVGKGDILDRDEVSCKVTFTLSCLCRTTYIALL